MIGKIILNLAISIDGYIAEEDGGFDWIVGDGNVSLNTKSKWDYEQFLKDIDVVVMGSNCYKQGFHKDFKGKEVYIATSQNINNYENYHFIEKDICKEIKDLKNNGKNIFLFGGGILIDYFIKEDSIDEYVIGVIPTILGKGRPLFYKNNPRIDLTLNCYSIEDGIVIMRYIKRKEGK